MTSLVTALFVPLGILHWFLRISAKCHNTPCVYSFNKAFSVWIYFPTSLSVCLQTCVSSCSSSVLLVLTVLVSGMLGGSHQTGGGNNHITTIWELRSEARANERQLSLLWSQQATANVMGETSGVDQWHINTQNMHIAHLHRRNGSVSHGCDLRRCFLWSHCVFFLPVIFNSLVLSTDVDVWRWN